MAVQAASDIGLNPFTFPFPAAASFRQKKSGRVQLMENLSKKVFYSKWAPTKFMHHYLAQLNFNNLITTVLEEKFEMIKSMI